MYEIKLADMKRARDVSNIVIDGLLGGTLEIKAANAITGATNNLIRAVTTDLKARLALPAIVESEAKLIEADKKPAPPISAPDKPSP